MAGMCGVVVPLPLATLSVCPALQGEEHLGLYSALFQIIFLPEYRYLFCFSRTQAKDIL